jgi:putative oxidoreductase
MLKYIVLGARLLIGGLFIYASIYKILDPAAFAASIRNYMIIPLSWTNLVAVMLPWIEIGAGLFLILGIQTRPSALLTSGMLAVFLGAVLYAYSIGLDIDCGCFSSAAGSAGRIGPWTIARDAAILLTSFLILVWDRGDFSIARLQFFGGRLRLLNDGQ